MVFSSVIFLFFFLPVSLLLYLFPGRKWRNSFFLIACLFFYAWTEYAYTLVLIFSILVNFIFGMLLNRELDREKGSTSEAKQKKRLLVFGICFNLGMLVVFKYSKFLLGNINYLSSWFGSPQLGLPSFYAPLGISFFTFHALSYLIDVYRGDAPVQKSPTGLAIYMAAFPKVLAGPIVRYGEAVKELSFRTLTSGAFVLGIERFITGLAKKVLIANPLAAVADAAFSLPADSLHPLHAWVGILCFTLQIYFDFSGYSDMAIGLGKMFGFDFPENFNFPYISQSVREFWRRWHISLSLWFRNYLYIPLGGNRCSAERTRINLIIVFLLCGFWHGASWNFIIWGGWYGLFLVLERTAMGKIIESAWRPLRHLYLLLVVVIGWVFFRADTTAYAIIYLKTLFGLHSGGVNAGEFGAMLNVELFCISVAAVVLCFPVSMFLRTIRSGLAGELQPVGFSKICLYASYVAWLGILLLASTLALAGGTHKAFIYFKF